MQIDQKNIQGLRDEEVTKSRAAYGVNKEHAGENRLLLHVLKEIFFQPMFILLLAACLIYFFVGRYSDGIIMMVSIFIVSGISLIPGIPQPGCGKRFKKIISAKV